MIFGPLMREEHTILNDDKHSICNTESYDDGLSGIPWFLHPSNDNKINFGLVLANR